MNDMNALTIDGASVRVTEQGLHFEGEVTFEEWRELGRKVGRVARTSLFLVGDWLVYGEARWNGGRRFEAMPEEQRSRYEDAMQETGLELKTLQNAANVARSIPIAERRPELTFEHHKEVARLKDPEARGEWLDKAEKNGLSTRRLRKSILLGRVAKDAELSGCASDRGIVNHLPWLNRLGAWWGEFRESGWIEGATREQVETMLRDFGPVLSIVEELHRAAESKEYTADIEQD